MKRHFYLIEIFVIIFYSCHQKRRDETTILKDDKNCVLLKNEIRSTFKQKDYKKTIQLFESFQDCYNDQLAFYLKLGLLYKITDQDSLSNRTLNKVADLIKSSNKYSSNEIALVKIYIYMMQDDKISMKREMGKINKSSLTSEQKNELNSMEIFVNQGEFISTKINVDFELFE